MHKKISEMYTKAGGAESEQICRESDGERFEAVERARSQPGLASVMRSTTSRLANNSGISSGNALEDSAAAAGGATAAAAADTAEEHPMQATQQPQPRRRTSSALAGGLAAALGGGYAAMGLGELVGPSARTTLRVGAAMGRRRDRARAARAQRQ